MINGFDLAQEQIKDLCSVYVDSISNKFNSDLEIKNFIDCVAYQVVSCYLGIKLFDSDLTLDGYLNSDKYSRLFNMISKNISKALKIGLTKKNISDLNFIIIHYVNYIYIEYIFRGYVYYPPVRAFTYEYHKDKE